MSDNKTKLNGVLSVSPKFQEALITHKSKQVNAFQPGIICVNESSIYLGRRELLFWKRGLAPVTAIAGEEQTCSVQAYNCMLCLRYPFRIILDFLKQIL